MEAQKGNLERAFAVDENHPEQGCKDRNVRNSLGVRQIENRFHTGAEGQLLLGEVAAHGVFHVFEFLEGELGGIEAAGNLRIEVAADESAEGNS